MSKNEDLYTRITDKIIADLERGVLPWRKSWHDEGLIGRVLLPLRWEGIPYTGINTLMLWIAASEKGYRSPYWMTYHQAEELKAHVRKGEKATTTVYSDKITKEEEGADGSKTSQTIRYMKQYSVFNAEQIEGLPERFYHQPEPIAATNHEQRIEALEQFFKRTNAEITTGYRAGYSQTFDRIEMPPFECFDDAASYYATLAHELTHWTKHPNRLSREFNCKTFGDEGYAKEELVAELGACFLAAELGFEPVIREEHASYIQMYLTVLQNDKRFIFTAAAHAQKAVEFIKQLQERAISEATMKPPLALPSPQP